MVKRASKGKAVNFDLSDLNQQSETSGGFYPSCSRGEHMFEPYGVQ
jgi:hypothetical protein